MNGKEVLVGRKKEASTRPRVYVNVGWLLRELVRVTRICTRAARRCVGIGSRAANGRVCAVGCAQRTRCAATFIRRGCSFTSYTFLSRIVRILCICKATLLARTCHFPFSKSILAPCAPPAQSTTSTLLPPGLYVFHCAPLLFSNVYTFFFSLLFYLFIFYFVRVLRSKTTNTN